jgi:hypothetical protein
MTHTDLKFRFDELCAGRAIGDLSPEEERELDALCNQHGLAPEPDFDLLATTLEINAVSRELEPMPAVLAIRLHKWADSASTPSLPTNVVSPRIPVWKTLVCNPISGWVAAAAAVVFAFTIPRQAPPLSPAQAEIRLRSEASDLIERDFSGLGEFGKAGGKVVWSGSRQEGYMILRGLPVNNAACEQYQLWIVDPTRDADSPVDGGVFDIPTDGFPVVVPITAKLAIHDPQVFLITLEKPGGVVKSKRNKEVALAKL